MKKTFRILGLSGFLMGMLNSTAYSAMEMEIHSEFHRLRFMTTQGDTQNKFGYSGNGGIGLMSTTQYGDFYGRFGYWASRTDDDIKQTNDKKWTRAGYFDLGYDWRFDNGITLGMYIRSLVGLGTSLYYHDNDNYKYVLQASPRVGYRFADLFGNTDLHMYAQYQHAINVRNIHQLFGAGIALNIPFSEDKPEVKKEPVEVVKPEPVTPAPEAPKVEVKQLVAPTMDVKFDFAKSDLTKDSAKLIKTLASLLNSNPTAWKTIEVHGHTDAKGTAEYNKALSEKRATFIKDQLVKNGVEANRINIFGHGAEQLLSNVASDTQEQRRVNIQVAGIAEDAFNNSVSNVLNGK